MEFLLMLIVLSFLISVYAMIYGLYRLFGFTYHA